MRIPWFVFLPSVVVMIALVWHLRTREMNFMAPSGVELPPEDFGENLVEGIPRLQPQILPQPEPIPAEEQKLADTSLTLVDLGDLEAAPGLAEYREFAQHQGAVKLLQLSSLLQARGHSQRAVLALERIIDSTAATPGEIAQAAAGIAALKPTLPAWIIDPSAAIPLDLHLTVAVRPDPAVSQALAEIASLIGRESGGQIEITPRLTVSPSSEEGTGATTLQISPPGEQSPVFLLRHLHRDHSTPAAELSKAIFRMVRAFLVDHGYPMPTTISPADLQQSMTRLMWAQYANALAPLAEETPLTQAEKGEISEEQF